MPNGIWHIKSIRNEHVPGLSSPVLMISVTSLPLSLALLILSSVTSDQKTRASAWWKSSAMAFSRPWRMDVYSDLLGITLRMSTRLAKIRYGSPPEKWERETFFLIFNFIHIIHDIHDIGASRPVFLYVSLNKRCTILSLKCSSLILDSALTGGVSLTLQDYVSRIHQD